MIIVQYDKNGIAISDFEAYEFVKNTILESRTKEKIYVHTSTQIVVHLFLRAIKDGFLNKNSLKIYQDIEEERLLDIRFDNDACLIDYIIEPDITEYDVFFKTEKIF